MVSSPPFLLGSSWGMDKDSFRAAAAVPAPAVVVVAAAGGPDAVVVAMV